jgi:ATP-dependent RNA helicase DeaD
MVDKLFLDMRKDFKDVEFTHAGLSQDKRSSLFRRFKQRKVRYLIASDVAGRGLDFSHVSHVVNWNYPRGNEQYTHRTGRTGRMGRKGKAFTFVTKNDVPALRDLIHKKKITPCWLGEDPLKVNRTHQKRNIHRKGKRPFRQHPAREKGKQK